MRYSSRVSIHLSLSSVRLSGALRLKVGRDGVEELDGLLVVLALEVLAVDAQGQVLGHGAALDGLNAGVLEVLAEVGQGGVVVEVGAVLEAGGPGEDGGDRVGGGLLALLPEAPVAGHGAVGGLGLDGLAV